MRRLFITLILSIFSLALSAQNVTDLIISEAMPSDSSSMVDDFGRHSAWVEVMNTSQGTVNFGGCYFTDDLSDMTKSPIVKGDSRTKLGPRQVALFHEGGDGATGTFYISFPVGRGTTLYLVSNNGRTVIDSITIPEDLAQGCSVSKFADDSKGMKFDRIEEASPTPMSVNGSSDRRSKAEVIKETDPHGWTLTVTCIFVVFCALLILFVIYALLGEIFKGTFKRKSKAAEMTPEVAAAIAMALEAETAGGEAVEAAIATALHLYLSEEVHDSESFVLTIRPRQTAWTNKNLISRKLPVK